MTIDVRRHMASLLRIGLRHGFFRLCLASQTSMSDVNSARRCNGGEHDNKRECRWLGNDGDPRLMVAGGIDAVTDNRRAVSGDALGIDQRPAREVQAKVVDEQIWKAAYAVSPVPDEGFRSASPRTTHAYDG